MIDFLAIVFLIITLGLAFFAWKNPFFGLASYLIIFLTRPCDVFPLLGIIHFERVMAIYFCIIMLFKLRGKNEVIVRIQNPVHMALLLFMATCIISIPLSVWPSNSVRWFIDLAKIAVFYLMIVNLIDTGKQLKSFIWLFVIFTGWVAYVPMWNYFHGGSYIAQGIERISGATGYFQNPNALANTLFQALPFAFFLLLDEKRRYFKLFLICLMVMYVFVIIITGSRNGFVGLSTVLLLLWVKSEHKVKSFLFVLIAVVLIWILMGEQYRARQLTMLELGKSDPSAEGRIEGLKHGFAMFLSRPFFGVGIGCYGNARGKMFGDWKWAHNHYAQLMGELGIAGIISWTAFVYLVFRNLHRAKRLLREANKTNGWLYHICTAVEISLIARLVGGMFTHSLYTFIWYFAAGLSVVLLRLVQKDIVIKEEEFRINDESLARAKT